MKDLNQILVYFPQDLQKIIKEEAEEELQEIRIRQGKPIVLKIGKNIKILKYIVKENEISEIFEKICENSIYTYKKQICEGFITIKGGHRVGITGNCVQEDGKIININYISSLNFRIAQERKDCSDKILKYVIDIENNNIFNTLIVSKPGAGKTTILRDLIRKISNGIPEIKFKGITCGIVDERGEIAAMQKGMPQNDIGVLTDVLDNSPKDKGMTMLVRSMSPTVIACDEIGSKEDMRSNTICDK